MSTPSIQEIGESVRVEEFVGRDSHLAHFGTLRGRTAGARRKFLLNVHGPSGVGKTALLNQFGHVAEGRGDQVAVIDDDVTTLVDALSLAADMLDPDTRFADFKRTINEYERHLSKIAADREIPEHLARFVGNLVGRGGAIAAHHFGGPPLTAGSEDALAAESEEIAAYLVRKLGGRQAAELVQDPVGQLGPLFVDGLRALAASGGDSVLLIDTRGGLTESFDDFLQLFFDGAFGDVVPQFLCVVATHQPIETPNSAWRRHSWLIDPLELGVFTEGEALSYLRLNGISDPNITAELLRGTDRMPVYLALASAFDHGSIDLTQLAGTAAEWSLRTISDKSRRDLLLALSVPRALNRDVAGVVLEESNADEAFEFFRNLPFVRQRSEGWIAHAAIRAQLIRQLKAESPERFETIQRRLSDHFTHVSKAKESPTAQALCEITYHDLCRSDATLPVARRAFIHAFGTGAREARDWVRAMSDAGHDMASTALSESASQLQQIVDAMDAGEPMTAVEGFNELIGDPVLSTDVMWTADAIHWRSHVRRIANDHFGAIDDLTKCLELDPDRAHIWAERATLHIESSEHRTAIDDLSEAIRISKNPLPTWFLQRSQSRLHVGQAAAALTDATYALDHKGNKGWARILRARAHDALGHVSEALAELRRASTIDATRHVAAVDTGQIYLRKHDATRAKQAFEVALRERPECTSCWADFGRAARAENASVNVVDVLMSFEVPEVSTIDVRACRALGLETLGALEEALAEFDQLADEPDFADSADWILPLRARCLEGLRRYDDAIRDLIETVERDPDDLHSCVWTARLLRLIGRHEEAIETLLAFPSSLDDCRIYAELGRTHAEMGNSSEACRCFERCVTATLSGYFSDRNETERGLALSYLGRLDEAIALADEGLANDEDSLAVNYNRAVWMARAKRSDAPNALDAVRLIIDKRPSPEEDVYCTYALAGIAAAADQKDGPQGPLTTLRNAIALDVNAVDWARHDVAWANFHGRTDFEDAIAKREGSPPEAS